LALRPQTRLSLWVAGLGLAGFAVFFGMLQIPVLSIPLLVAAALGYLLAPLLDLIESRGRSRNFAAVSVTLVFLAAAAVGALYLPDWVGDQSRAFAANWETGLARLHEFAALAENQIRAFAPFVGPLNLESQLDVKGSELGGTVLRALPNVLVQAILGLVMLPLFAFFLLRDGRLAKRALLETVPNRHFEMTLNILWRINEQVGAYLRGVLLEAGLVGLTAFVMLAAGAWATGLTGVLPMSGILLIAAVVGLTNLIPYFGPVAGGLTGLTYIIFTFPDSSMLTTGVAVVLAAVAVAQLADNAIIGPLVIGRAVDVHPIAVVLLLLVFGRMFGLLGLVVAVPVWVVARVLVSETRSAVRSYGQHVVDRRPA
jgi:putative permease